MATSGATPSHPGRQRSVPPRAVLETKGRSEALWWLIALISLAVVLYFALMR